MKKHSHETQCKNLKYSLSRLTSQFCVWICFLEHHENTIIFINVDSIIFKHRPKVLHRDHTIIVFFYSRCLNFYTIQSSCSFFTAYVCIVSMEHLKVCMWTVSKTHNKTHRCCDVKISWVFINSLAASKMWKNKTMLSTNFSLNQHVLPNSDV